MDKLEFRDQLIDFGSNMASFATFAHENQERDFKLPTEIVEFNRMFKNAMLDDADASDKLITAWNETNIDQVMKSMQALIAAAMEQRGRYIN